MKKKGFTLIELIVVIAIIGVLAAILVPAMLGYVKKSKITSANSAAKSIYTAAQSALTDLDTMDIDIYSFTGWTETSKLSAVPAAPAGSTDVDVNFKYKVYTYFEDITALDAFSIYVSGGSCEGVGVVDGNYPGTAPTQFNVDNYSKTVSYKSNVASLAQAATRAAASANP